MIISSVCWRKTLLQLDFKKIYISVSLWSPTKLLSHKAILHSVTFRGEMCFLLDNSRSLKQFETCG